MIMNASSQRGYIFWHYETRKCTSSWAHVFILFVFILTHEIGDKENGQYGGTRNIKQRPRHLKC